MCNVRKHFRTATHCRSTARASVAVRVRTRTQKPSALARVRPNTGTQRLALVSASRSSSAPPALCLTSPLAGSVVLTIFHWFRRRLISIQDVLQCKTICICKNVRKQQTPSHPSHLGRAAKGEETEELPPGKPSLALMSEYLRSSVFWTVNFTTLSYYIVLIALSFRLIKFPSTIVLLQ